MIRRINLLGGPNCGKSATALAIASHFKQCGIRMEYIEEHVKKWAYKKIKPSGHNQVYLFAQQQYAEETCLANGVDYIVTDCPLMLAVAYGIRDGYKCVDELASIASKFAVDYPEFNIVLDRTGLPYDPVGRYESEDEAKFMDDLIIKTLEDAGAPYVVWSPLDAIPKLLFSKLGL